MPTATELPLTRLLARCEPMNDNGCILWKGATYDNGYGLFNIEGKNWRTHRLAYTLANGDIPEGALIGHKCDVRLCCNPEHLEAITHIENMRQMAERGRAKKEYKRVEHSLRVRIANSPKTIKALALEYDLDTRTVERYRARYKGQIETTANETPQ